MIEPAPTPQGTAARAPLTGCVLCGGKSVRMGRDKALVELDGAPLVVRAQRILQSVCERVLLASGSGQRYPELGLQELGDPFPGAGPASGLLAALESARTPWVALLSCDQPRVRPATLLALQRRAQSEDAEACLLESEQGLEPTIAVYHVSLAGRVRAALERGQRRLVAFHPDARIARLAASEAHLDEALNVNTPEDLLRAEELERAEDLANSAVPERATSPECAPAPRPGALHE